jgi:hypothetical protein
LPAGLTVVLFSVTSTAAIMTTERIPDAAFSTLQKPLLNFIDVDYDIMDKLKDYYRFLKGQQR